MWHLNAIAVVNFFFHYTLKSPRNAKQMAINWWINNYNWNFYLYWSNYVVRFFIMCCSKIYAFLVMLYGYLSRRSNDAPATARVPRVARSWQRKTHSSILFTFFHEIILYARIDARSCTSLPHKRALQPALTNLRMAHYHSVFFATIAAAPSTIWKRIYTNGLKEPV